MTRRHVSTRSAQPRNLLPRLRVWRRSTTSPLRWPPYAGGRLGPRVSAAGSRSSWGRVSTSHAPAMLPPCTYGRGGGGLPLRCEPLLKMSCASLPPSMMRPAETASCAGGSPCPSIEASLPTNGVFAGSTRQTPLCRPTGQPWPRASSPARRRYCTASVAIAKHW